VDYIAPACAPLADGEDGARPRAPDTSRMPAAIQPDTAGAINT
jgi:hypothetical protein